jgi:hypothetical protein
MVAYPFPGKLLSDRREGVLELLNCNVNLSPSGEGFWVQMSPEKHVFHVDLSSSFPPKPKD